MHIYISRRRLIKLCSSYIIVSYCLTGYYDECDNLRSYDLCLSTPEGPKGACKTGYEIRAPMNVCKAVENFTMV